MLFDPLSFSSNYRVDVREYFYSGSGASNVTPQIWEKPKWAKFVFVFLMGAGGAGSAGTSGVAGTNRNGGNGGGSAATTRAFGLAAVFPDTLFIAVAKGQVPGVASIDSYIWTKPNINTNQLTPNNVFLRAVSASNNTAGSSTLITNSTTSAFFLNYLTSGGFGGALGSTAGGTNTTPFSNNFISIGLAGGGLNTTNTQTAGNGWSGSALLPLKNTIPGGTAGGGNGNVGVTLTPPISPFANTGGTGGGSNSAGTGGNGGNGALGSGGGGGGAGLTGGNGGNGGNGYCLIISY